MQVLPAAPAMAIGQYHVFKIGGAHERWLGDDEWPESDSEGENNNLRTSSDEASDDRMEDDEDLADEDEDEDDEDDVVVTRSLPAPSTGGDLSPSDVQDMGIRALQNMSGRDFLSLEIINDLMYTIAQIDLLEATKKAVLLTKRDAHLAGRPNAKKGQAYKTLLRQVKRTLSKEMRIESPVPDAKDQDSYPIEEAVERIQSIGGDDKLRKILQNALGWLDCHGWDVLETQIMALADEQKRELWKEAIEHIGLEDATSCACYSAFLDD